MKFFYKGIEKGEIKESGEVIFKDKVLQDNQEGLFHSIKQEELDDGGIALVHDELSIDLKISTLKELGFEFKD